MVCADPITAVVCQASADQAQSAVGGVLAGLAEVMGEAASWLITNLWSVFDATTVVDLTSGRFTRVYGLVFGVAVFLMLAFFLFQLITGMLRREPGALARAVGGLAKSVLGSVAVVTLTGTLLAITDQVCLGIVAAAGTTMDDLGADLALVGLSTTLAAGMPTVGPLIALFIAGLAVSAAFILWISLLVRKALLLMAVALAPMALAGASWDATRGWVSRWAQFVVALILSKLVVVVVFLLATSLITTPIDGDLAVLSEKLTGVVLLAVAAFAPYLTYKAINFMGFDMYHAMSIEQETKSALNRPVPITAVSALAGGVAARNIPKVLGPDGGVAGASGGRAASASAGQSAAGTGGGGAAGAAKAGAAGAGAGAAVAVPLVLGAQAAKTAATAGPRAGRAIGRAAGEQAGSLSATGSAPSSSVPARRPPDGISSQARRQAAGSPPPRPPVREVPTVLKDKGDRR